MSRQPNFDLLRAPLVGPFLRWRHSRTFLQIPLLLIGLIMIAHGLFGPTLAPKNLATTLGWVHFRGALVLVLLCAGNFFCFACPFILVRDLARRFFQPVLNWPRVLRNKWLSVALLVAILFSYELFGLWSSPLWTACLIAAYFLTALAVDGIFKHASFCKFVCPIGQFNFVASLVSPLEVKVRHQGVCSSCATKDCIKGRSAPVLPISLSSEGCRISALSSRWKAGNMDCTFCLDCVHACPHDNVGITARPVAAELMIDPSRSGIGRFSRRKDISALVTVFTFGALLNAFGMVSPVYALESWLSRKLHVSHQAPVLGLIFTFFLIVEPAVLLGLAAWATKAWSRSGLALLPLAVRYSYGLVPLGFAMWLAHYSFHFLTGLYTLIPVAQSAVASLGLPLLGEPRWRLTGISVSLVQPIELGFIVLGLAASLILTHRLAEEDSPGTLTPRFRSAPGRRSAYWYGARRFWLVLQPMDMRGTFLAG